MALLGDDDFREAINPAHILLPLMISLDNLDIVIILRRLGLLARDIIILALDEEDNVGVLLDRAGFTKVGQLRTLILALFDRAGEL